MDDSQSVTQDTALSSLYSEYVKLYIHFDSLRWQLPLLAAGGVGLVTTAASLIIGRFEVGLYGSVGVAATLAFGSFFLAVVAQAWSRILAGQDKTVSVLKALEERLLSKTGCDVQTFFSWRADVLRDHRKIPSGIVAIPRGVSAQMSLFLWGSSIGTGAGSVATLLNAAFLLWQTTPPG